MRYDTDDTMCMNYVGFVRAYIEEIGSGPLSFPIIVYRSRGNKRYVPE
jgi:hypothetical protein